MVKKKVRISDLKKRATIQRWSATQDANGRLSTNAWTDQSTVWCSVKPLSGIERDIRDRFSRDITHQVIMRSSVDVTEKDRLIIDGRELTVKYVITFEEGRDFYKQLSCVEGDAEKAQ